MPGPYRIAGHLRGCLRATRAFRYWVLLVPEPGQPGCCRLGGYLGDHANTSGIGSGSVGDHDGRIDAEFAALPLRNLADAALDAARTLGADHADFRLERVRGQRIALSDGKLESLSDADDSGLAVRVVVDGTWGFAASVDLTPEAARDAARHAF